MVLKYIVLLFALTSFNAFGKYDKNYFKKAQYQYKKKRYESALSYLKKSFNTKNTKSIPTPGLYLLASTYQKLKSHKKAIYYYNYLIKKSYKKNHRKVIQALKKGNLDDEFPIPKLLNATYLNLSQSYLAQYIKSSKVIYAKNAKTYLTICDEVDFNEKCSDLLERLESQKNYVKKSKRSYSGYFFAGQFLLQDRVSIKEDSSGMASDLIANNDALCYGAGLRYGNSYNGYFASGCVFYGTASIVGIAEGESQTNNYSQNGVPIAGFYIDGGYYKLLDDEATRLSLSFPIIYRVGTYTNPDGFTVTNAKDYSFGLSAGASMKLLWFEVETKFSHLGDSNLLMLNLIYNL